uniref:Uncharacterized protein n=1 Tax=Rhizophora mucronata TaxID=61149 RepID=A0A2P2J621_RHIMU
MTARMWQKEKNSFFLHSLRGLSFLILIFFFISLRINQDSTMLRVKGSNFQSRGIKNH